MFVGAASVPCRPLGVPAEPPHNTQNPQNPVCGLSVQVSASRAGRWSFAQNPAESPQYSTLPSAGVVGRGEPVGRPSGVVWLPRRGLRRAVRERAG